MGITQKSNYRGVVENTPNPGAPYNGLKWKAVITYKGKRRILLYSDDPEVVAREYDRWAKYYFKNKAVLNFPNEN